VRLLCPLGHEQHCALKQLLWLYREEPHAVRCDKNAPRNAAIWPQGKILLAPPESQNIYQIQRGLSVQGDALRDTEEIAASFLHPHVILLPRREFHGSRWYSRQWLLAQIRFELHRPKSVSAIFHPQKCMGISAQEAGCATPQHAQNLLIQVAYCTWADSATPKSLGDVLNPPYRHVSQAHRYQGLFHRAFTAAISFDYRGSKRHVP